MPPQCIHLLEVLARDSVSHTTLNWKVCHALSLHSIATRTHHEADLANVVKEWDIPFQHISVQKLLQDLQVRLPVQAPQEGLLWAKHFMNDSVMSAKIKSGGREEGKKVIVKEH